MDTIFVNITPIIKFLSNGIWINHVDHQPMLGFSGFLQIQEDLNAQYLGTDKIMFLKDIPKIGRDMEAINVCATDLLATHIMLSRMTKDRYSPEQFSRCRKSIEENRVLLENLVIN